MLDDLIKSKPSVHSRDIKLATYAHGESKIIVHGVLKDLRLVKLFDLTGKILEPGVIHHMDVKLLVKSDPLTIEQAEATMIQVPLEECRATLDTMGQLSGMEIKAGFSKKIQDLTGKKNGCTHLSQLIIAMGQEIVQGWLTHKRSTTPPEIHDLDNFKEKKYLIDSCRVVTYGQVAAMAGQQTGARQVSRLLHSMSRKYKLPWHRVINSKGKISLPPSKGYELQKALLESEGIEFSISDKIDMDKFGVKQEWKQSFTDDWFAF